MGILQYTIEGYSEAPRPIHSSENHETEPLLQPRPFGSRGGTD